VPRRDEWAIEDRQAVGELTAGRASRDVAVGGLAIREGDGSAYVPTLDGREVA
jgi:hypothetical protein